MDECIVKQVPPPTVPEDFSLSEHRGSLYGRGHGFALLKYLCSDESVRYEFNQKPRLPIKHNYMGSQHPASGWLGMSPISVDDSQWTTSSFMTLAKPLLTCSVWRAKLTTMRWESQ